MPTRFSKPIVTAGAFQVAGPDGSRRWEVITPARLSAWAENTNKLLASGNRVPAPWAHDASAVPAKIGPGGTLPRSDINGGWWDKFWTAEDSNGVPTLYGEVEAEGDPNDPNTPAGKIGKTVRETSVFAVPEFTDGTGSKFGSGPGQEVLTHVALVTHPIQPGQANFAPISAPAGTLALSMSHCAATLIQSPRSVTFSLPIQMAPAQSEPGQSPSYTSQKPGSSNTLAPGGGITSSDPTESTTNPSIAQLLQALQSKGLKLPADTTPDNLMERLLIALGQSLHDQQNAQSQATPPQPRPVSPPPKKPGDTFDPPSGAQERPASIAMSVTPGTQPAAGTQPVTTTGTDPAGDMNALLMSNPHFQAQVNANRALVGYINTQESASRANRVKTLVRSGRITQKFADEKLAPMLAGFQMSFGADGKPAPHAIDTILEALEAATPLASPSTPGYDPRGLFAPGDMAALAPLLAMSLPASQMPPGLVEQPHSSATQDDPLRDPKKLDEAASEFLANVGY